MTDEFHKVVNLADLPQGQARVFSVAGRRLAVCHVEDGDCYAIDDLCTHDGGPLGEGELDGNQIECPRHGARFDVTTGKALCLPAVLPVRNYKVEIRNDEVWIAVPVGVTGGA
jgi:3-phenylpropionate/trans-cinnamate dioxygenase ferredoxin component